MLNLNYNINASNLERARFTEQENEAFRKFQIQYVIVPGGGGAAAGNNEFEYDMPLPSFGIAGNGGVVVTGSFCVEPFATYPITVGKGGKGGIKSTTSYLYSGSQGENSAFYNIEAIGGQGGKTQLYATASGLAGNGSQTIAVVANGGSGSQWTYNLPGCLPDPFNPGCHGGELISSSYYAGGGAGVVVSQSYVPVVFDYLIVGGGGSGQSTTTAGGAKYAGGGGGGAVISSSFDYTLLSNLNSYKSGNNYVFNITVGSGGAGVASANNGNSGGTSTFIEISAQGGSGGNNTSGGNSGTGSANSNYTTGFTGGTQAGGGAGARADGGNGDPLTPYAGGNGGNGALWSGSYFGAGAGGQMTPGGGDIYSGTNGLGISNYGSGTGGIVNGTSSQTGQSGVVKIKYFGVKKPFINGGSVDYDGTYTTHTFTSSSQLIISPSIPTLDIEFLVVGAGGGGMNNENTCAGGTSFGGGGGAAITGSFKLQPLIQSYPIVVGAGGKGSYACTVVSASNGENSSAFGVIAGGGEGAYTAGSQKAGNSGTGSIGLLLPKSGSAGGGGNTSTGSALISLGGGNWTGANGGNGYQWFDGYYYGAGGYGGQQGSGNVYNGNYGTNSQVLGYYPGRGGAGVPQNSYTALSNGDSGSVVLRYYGTGSKGTGGTISYNLTDGYTYHYFTASANFVLLESSASMFTSGIPGEGDGNSLFNTSGSLAPIAYTGGGGAASNWNQNGVSGSDGFVAIRYEGAPLADGGTIIITDHYTYHLFSSSADFYVTGQESDPNINPCP